MRRERSFGSYLAVCILWLVIAASRATIMIGKPARWVDILMLVACGVIAGAFLAKAKQAWRARSVTPPEISGGAPIVPK
jgi:hypothetical protein